MNREDNRSPGFFGMGASLLLTVLLVLMLVTFSLLSLSTSRSDLKRSQLLADRKTAYYEANNRAERVLSQIKNGEATDVEVVLEGEILKYEIPITSDQVLVVNLQLHEGKYNILAWKAESR